MKEKELEITPYVLPPPPVPVTLVFVLSHLQAHPFAGPAILALGPQPSLFVIFGDSLIVPCCL